MPPDHATEIVLAAFAWIAFAWVCHAAPKGPRKDPIGAMAWMALRGYIWLMHAPLVVGREHVPTPRPGDPPPGPLILVSNHTAGIDPLLIHSACTLDVRWMMMRQMMWAPLNALWEWLEIIPVEKNGRDAASLRTSLRLLGEGGVVGIFAEGGLERPPGRIMPYQPGVGLLVLKSKARVLPVVIEGTPRVRHAFASLLVPSRPVIRFLPMRDFAGTTMTAAQIAESLEIEAAAALGWPRQAAAAAA